jgi:hypothetical protein
VGVLPRTRRRRHQITAYPQVSRALAHTRRGPSVRQLVTLRRDVADLQGKVGGLTVPTDPLAAYDQICTVQATNSASGVSQVYYYPCTNNARTIPQPGN